MHDDDAPPSHMSTQRFQRREPAVVAEGGEAHGVGVFVQILPSAQLPQLLCKSRSRLCGSGGIGIETGKQSAWLVECGKVEEGYIVEGIDNIVQIKRRFVGDGLIAFAKGRGVVTQLSRAEEGEHRPAQNAASFLPAEESRVSCDAQRRPAQLIRRGDACAKEGQFFKEHELERRAHLLRFRKSQGAHRIERVQHYLRPFGAKDVARRLEDRTSDRDAPCFSLDIRQRLQDGKIPLCKRFQFAFAVFQDVEQPCLLGIVAFLSG